MTDDGIQNVCDLARLFILGFGKLDLEGQDYGTVATLYVVRDQLAEALELAEAVDGRDG